MMVNTTRHSVTKLLKQGYKLIGMAVNVANKIEHSQRTSIKSTSTSPMLILRLPEIKEAEQPHGPPMSI